MFTKSDNREVGVILYGGLGNQLFQFAAAHTVALKQGTEVRLDLLGETRDSDSGLPEIYDFKLVNNNYERLAKVKHHKIVKKLVQLLLRISNSETTNLLFRTLLFLTSILVKMFVRTITRLRIVHPKGLGFDSQMKIPHLSFSLLGNFHSYRWISEETKRYLVQKMEIREENSILQEYSKLAKIERPTAIHIRLGDYLNIRELNVVSQEFFTDGIRYLDSKTDLKNIWIFSNEPDRYMNYMPEIVNQNVRVIPTSLSSSETLQIMRMCSNYVISNSTFSWWGAFLSLSEDSIVVAPRDWFKNRNEPADICPDTWIRL